MRAPVLTFERAKRLRRQLTLPEVVLWHHLRARKLAGIRFRRQHPVGPYILDFYCSEAQLCVEIDGAAHNTLEQAAHDERRTRWLNAKGIKVMRVGASDILKDEHLPGVLKAIELATAPSTAVPSVPLPRIAGEDQE
jgi:very-short-patch-repair endonuclease